MQSPPGKDGAATTEKLTKEQELEEKVLEPREKEPLIRAHHDQGYIAERLLDLRYTPPSYSTTTTTRQKINLSEL